MLKGWTTSKVLSWIVTIAGLVYGFVTILNHGLEGSGTMMALVGMGMAGAGIKNFTQMMENKK